MAKHALLRELSHGEQAFFLGSISVPTLSVIRGNIPAYVIQHSFNLLLAKSPLLRCKVVEYNSTYHFCPADTQHFQVNEHVISDDADAYQAYESLVTKGGTPSSNLVSLQIYRPKHAKYFFIISNLSHIISDGLSNVRFHRMLLEGCEFAYRTQVQDLSTDISTITSSAIKSVSLAIEDYLVPRFDGFQVNDVIKQYLSDISRNEHTLLNTKTDKKEKALKGEPVRVSNFTLTKTQTSTLISWCKKQGVSVNNALIASLLISANDFFTNKSNTFLVRQAVNLREKVIPKIDTSEYITAATSILTSHTIHNRDKLETICKQVAQLSKQALELAPTLQNHIANKELAKHIKVPLAFHISNLGRLDIHSRFKSFGLEKVLVAPSSNFGNTIPLFITTFEGQLNITSHTDDYIYPQEQISKIIWGAVELLCPDTLYETQLVN